jgi:N-acetylglucosaminyl-diphospho-decaprenol L-rhamnosyltransferase
VPEPYDLSILIVNWNGREMLRALLGSIDATRENLRIQTIVVDNASADGSAEMVEGNFPAVTLIKNTDNRGFGRGNNQAAALATAPLLLLLNNDTIVRPGALQTLVNFLNGAPGAVAVSPKLIGGDGHAQRTGRNLPTFGALLNTIQFLKWTGLFRKAYKKYRRGGFDPEISGPVGQLAAAALMIRASAFNACKGFDEGYEFGVEDVDLCARLAAHGSIQYLKDAEIDHLGRVSSRANRGFVYRAYECGWARYLGKHHGRFRSVIYKILVTLDMPVRLMVMCLQWAMQKLSGKTAKAERTAGILKAASEFAIRGLPKFWRA